MGKSDDETIARAVQKAGFARAAEKDARAENGITNRVDFLLDEMNKKKGK